MRADRRLQRGVMPQFVASEISATILQIPGPTLRWRWPPVRSAQTASPMVGCAMTVPKEFLQKSSALLEDTPLPDANLKIAEDRL